MASSKMLILGLYAIVKFVCLDIGNAQISDIGLVSRDPFRQPPFHRERVGNIFTNHLNFPKNAIGFTENENRQFMVRSSRPNSYNNTYGTRGKRSASDHHFQKVQKGFPEIIGIRYQHARVKRQTAPVYQTWDFHPSSIARRNKAHNSEPIFHHSTRPKSPMPSKKLSKSQNKIANKAPIVKHSTTNKVNDVVKDQLPFAHFNAMLQQNNLALDPKHSKPKKDTTNKNAAQNDFYSQPKPNDAAKSLKIRNKNFVKDASKATKRIYSEKPSPQTANQLQNDLTLAAAALLDGDTKFDALNSNIVNDNNILLGDDTRSGSTKRLTSNENQYSNPRMLSNIKQLNAFIDRVEQILMNRRNEKHSKDDFLKPAKVRSTTVTQKARSPKTNFHPRQANDKIVSAVSHGNTMHVQTKSTKEAAETIPQTQKLKQQNLQSMSVDLQSKFLQEPSTQQNKRETLKLMENSLPQLSSRDRAQPLLNRMASKTQSKPKQYVNNTQNQLNQQYILNADSKTLQGPPHLAHDQQQLQNNQKTLQQQMLNHQKQEMPNNQNQQDTRQLPQNSHIKPQTVDKQHQSTPRTLPPVKQSQQEMLLSQYQPTPSTVTPIFQSHQQMMDNQQKSTPIPQSANYQSQQLTSHNQHQSATLPLSTNYQFQPMSNYQFLHKLKPASPNAQSLQFMSNNQNQPANQQLSPKSQLQQQPMSNNQLQQLAEQSFPNSQSQQFMSNYQHLSAPTTLSPNYQMRQQQMLNNQLQQAPEQSSPNAKSKQVMQNIQDQPAHLPLSLDYQMQQQSMSNNLLQQTPQSSSPNAQSQQFMSNNHNQQAKLHSSPNHQLQQQPMSNYQHQETSLPLTHPKRFTNKHQPTPQQLSQSYQEQQQILTNQQNALRQPLSPNHNSQNQMSNYQNKPNLQALYKKYHSQEQLMNNQHQLTNKPFNQNNLSYQPMVNNQHESKTGLLSRQHVSNNQQKAKYMPLSPNYQSQQQVLNNQQTSTPRPLSANYKPQQEMINYQQRKTPQTISSNYQSQPQTLNSQNQQILSQTPYNNQSKLQQQFSRNNIQQQQHQQPQQEKSRQQQEQESYINTHFQPHPNPTNEPHSQSNKFQLQGKMLAPQQMYRNTKHTQQRKNHRSKTPQYQPMQSQKNTMQLNRQISSHKERQAPSNRIPTLAPKLRLKQKNTVQGIPLSIDGHGLSAFNHESFHKRRSRAKDSLNKVTTTPLPSRMMLTKRQRIPHERYIIYRSTTPSSPRHSKSRRQKNHSRRIPSPVSEEGAPASSSHNRRTRTRPVQLWNSSPNAPVKNLLWKQSLEQINGTQSPNPSPASSPNGSVNGGSYIKNWFYPRKFENSRGSKYGLAQSETSSKQHRNITQAKHGGTQGVSEKRKRTRSKHVISQQSRNGRRPGIRVLKRPETKTPSSKKERPSITNSQISRESTSKPPVSSTSSPLSNQISAIGTTAENSQHNSWNQPNTATQTSNVWNQYPAKEPQVSASVDAFRLTHGALNLSINAQNNKTNVQTNVSNQSTVNDVKKNRTISITQQIKKSAIPTQAPHHAHAPINFNVFLDVKPTPKPQQHNISHAADMLKLLKALKILRDAVRPPTTMHPPVKFVFQMEPQVTQPTQPAKLMCRCFKKADGCPAELKEEPLMDMCYENDTIPCCDDG